MNEKMMAIIWKKHLDKNPPKETETYEMKFTRGTRMPWEAVKEHQIYYLSKSSEGLYYKIPDMASIGGFSGKKPFDSFYIHDAKPYIVVWFYKPRAKKIFYKIKLIEFVKHKEKSSVKSFKESEVVLFSQPVEVT